MLLSSQFVVTANPLFWRCTVFVQSFIIHITNFEKEILAYLMAEFQRLN